jgi:hypothetical protein
MLMLAMALACVRCAAHLLGGGCMEAWRNVAVMALTMLVVHLLIGLPMEHGSSMVNGGAQGTMGGHTMDVAMVPARSMDWIMIWMWIGPILTAGLALVGLTLDPQMRRQRWRRLVAGENSVLDTPEEGAARPYGQTDRGRRPGSG